MIKRTLYFGNPAYLRLQNKQLKVIQPEKKQELASIPIEDIGVMVLDHQQITLSNALLSELLNSNVAVVGCDKTHHPKGLFLPLETHSLQSKRFKIQINASEALTKNLWAQTVHAKVKNQAKHLSIQGKDSKRLEAMLPQIKTGDPDNIEGRAAKVYWSTLIDDPLFVRDRYGMPPNSHLNYAYAIVRAAMARALVGSGLFPTFGIFHRNQYNSYCLADDIMEPYRPFCDQVVMQIFAKKEVNDDYFEPITKEEKSNILSLLNSDVILAKKKSPLMVAINRTTNSLFECFEGKRRKILYPSFHDINSFKNN